MIPAIYHLEAKVITRGVGRSAVAASAYMSCSEIINDYDGVKHDYTRKGGLVYEKIFLPSHAPPEWSNRSKLWNAVEETEKTDFIWYLKKISLWALIGYRNFWCSLGLCSPICFFM